MFKKKREAGLIVLIILMFCFSAFEIGRSYLQSFRSDSHIAFHLSDNHNLYEFFFDDVFFDYIPAFIGNIPAGDPEKIKKGFQEFYQRTEEIEFTLQNDPAGLKIYKEMSQSFLIFKAKMMDAVEKKQDQNVQALYDSYHVFKTDLSLLLSYVSEQSENRHLEAARQKYKITFLSLIMMIVAGFGLMCILLFKLRDIQKESAHKNQALENMESAQKESARHLAAIQFANEGIIIIDSDGCTVFMNHSLMKIHGISESEVPSFIGSPWYHIYCEPGQKEVLKTVIPALQEHQFWTGERKVRSYNDKFFYGALSITVLPDGGMLGIVRDITDRMKATIEKDELQKQFYQAQKMEALGRLAGGVAHDFNNILASILGYSEFLTEDLDRDSKEHHFATQIMKGGIQAQELVEQILAFSRRHDAAMSSIRISDVVESTLSMIMATLPVKIQLAQHIDPNNDRVRGNATQIGQTMMNLCVNAIDAIEDRGGYVEVRQTTILSNDTDFPGMLRDKAENRKGFKIHTAEDKSGYLTLENGSLKPDQHYVCFSVKDDGTGIPRDVLEKIFEPFFTTKDVDRGTGLGMSTVHGIVSAHDGAMAIRTKPGEGTRFVIYLPVQEEPLLADDEEHDFEAVELTGHVLVVEDNETVQKMILTMLERKGFLVTCCDNALSAIDVLRENPKKFDLIVSDYAMPEMTGEEMAAEMAIDFPDIPIIMVSGYSDKNMDDIVAQNPNIKAALSKPLKKNIFMENILNVLMSQNTERS
jgi:PAS domain S-box-containing protein